MSTRMHGTAEWTVATGDMQAFSDRSNRRIRSLPLGLSGILSRQGLYWNTNHDQGHGICVAPNRTGKGASVIIPALLTYCGSVFCIDPKGEAAWVTAPRRRELGSRVVILDPFGEVNRLYGEGKQVEQPTKFNPLSVIDPKSETFPEDVASLAEAMIIKTPGEKPHFPDSARELTAGVIALVKERFGSQATLRHVRRLLTDDPDILKALADEEAEANPNSLGVRKLRRFFKQDNDEILSVRSTAETQTAFLDSEQLLNAMEDEDEPFDLQSFTSSNVTIFLVLPPARLETHARWLRLILALTLRAITRQDRPPDVAHLLLLDEMGTIGALKPLETGFGQIAGYGVRFFGFLQTLGQLKGDYPQTWETFIGNCSYFQCLGARDIETAKYVSELLGTSTHDWVKRDQYGQETDRRQEGKPLMFPKDIQDKIGRDPKNLERNLQIVIGLQGGTNYLAYQNPYFKQPNWNGWYRPIPWLNNGPAAFPVVAAPVPPKPKAKWKVKLFGAAMVLVLLAALGDHFLAPSTHVLGIMGPGDADNEARAAIRKAVVARMNADPATNKKLWVFGQPGPQIYLSSPDEASLQTVEKWPVGDVWYQMPVTCKAHLRMGQWMIEPCSTGSVTSPKR